MTTSPDIWPPEPIVMPKRFKDLVIRFFEISNSADPKSGRLFAEEIFTEDGFFKTHETCVARGRKEIAASRERNSPLIVRRRHALKQVFASNSPATDIVVLGNFTICFVDGTDTTFDFTARFKAVGKGDEMRFSFVQVWTDSMPMLEAMKRLKEQGAGQ